MRQTTFLVFTLTLLVRPVDSTAQHAPATAAPTTHAAPAQNGHAATPAPPAKAPKAESPKGPAAAPPNAHTAPAARTAAPADAHAAPATKPAATDAHASAAAKPSAAGHASPAAAPTSANDHGQAPTASAAKPGTAKAKAGAENGLATALTRIQERIETETGPNARPRAAVVRRAAPVAATPARVASPAVRLTWRTSLKWPDELKAETLLIPLPPIELTWK